MCSQRRIFRGGGVLVCQTPSKNIGVLGHQYFIWDLGSPQDPLFFLEKIYFISYLIYMTLF